MGNNDVSFGTGIVVANLPHVGPFGEVAFDINSQPAFAVRVYCRRRPICISDRGFPKTLSERRAQVQLADIIVLIGFVEIGDEIFLVRVATEAIVVLQSRELAKTSGAEQLGVRFLDSLIVRRNAASLGVVLVTLGE